MWRYILAGFTGAVAGVAILIGALFVFVPDEEAIGTNVAPAMQPTQQQQVLCDDALARRRQAEAALAGPGASSLAFKQRSSASAAVGRYCGGS